MGQAPHLENAVSHAGQPHVALERAGGGPLAIMGRGIDLSRELGSVIGLAGAPTGPEALIDALTGVTPDTELRITLDGRATTLSQPSRGGPKRHRLRLRRSRQQGDPRHLADHRQHDGVRAASCGANGGAVFGSRRLGRLLKTLRIKARSVWHLAVDAERRHSAEAAYRPMAQSQPKMLVLEEPTRGVDIGTKREIYDADPSHRRRMARR